MSARLSVIAGLLAGALAALLLAGGLVAFWPENELATARPSPATSPTATAARPTAAATPSAPAGSASAAPPSGSATSANFHVGEPAPPLVVAQVGGGTIDLAALKGKPVWVNFMATWCPPCRDEFPLMNGYSARYASTGLVIIAVDVREDEGIVAAFAQSLNTSFPIGLDSDGSAQRAWGALALPVHFWVDAQGIVRDGALGGIGPDIMARGLQSILPGVTVKP